LKTRPLSKSLPPLFLSQERNSLIADQVVFQKFLAIVAGGKVRHIKPPQLVFKRTINVYLLTYLVTHLLNSCVTFDAVVLQKNLNWLIICTILAFLSQGAPNAEVDLGIDRCGRYESAA